MSATSTTQSSKSNEVTTKQHGPREGSVMWAVVQVLDGKRKPMTPNEILTEIKNRRLAKKLDGKTPEASVAARLAVHAAKGLYVERPEKGKYQLKKGVTAKSLASSSTRATPATPKRRTARKPAATKDERASTADARRSQVAAAPQSEATSEQATPKPEPATTA